MHRHLYDVVVYIYVLLMTIISRILWEHYDCLDNYVT